MLSKGFLAVAVSLAAAVASPAYAAETFTATFTQPDGGVSSELYSGLVNVTVSGIGQSDGTFFNDAFYLLGNDPGADRNYYQLTFGTSTLVANNPAQNAVNFIVGGRPAQQANSIYRFTLDTRTATPSRLHFGVGDGVFADNTGAFQITLAAVPEPATWAMMIVGFGAVGGAMRRRKAKVTTTVAYA